MRDPFPVEESKRRPPDGTPESAAARWPAGGSKSSPNGMSGGCKNCDAGPAAGSGVVRHDLAGGLSRSITTSDVFASMSNTKGVRSAS